MTDIANLLDEDWEKLAAELNISPKNVEQIKEEYPEKPAQQAAAMFKLWKNDEDKATGKISFILKFKYNLYRQPPKYYRTGVKV